MELCTSALTRRQAVTAAATLGSWLAAGTRAHAATVSGALRLGQIGCRASDGGAVAFARDPGHVLDQLHMRITHAWDARPERAAAFAGQRGITAVPHPSKMAGHVDGVLVSDTRAVYWYPDLLGALLQSGTPVWIDGALASSMLNSRELVRAARGAALAACTTEEFLPFTALLRRKVQELAPLTAGMAVVNTDPDDEDPWTGARAVNFGCAVFGMGVRKVSRLAASTRRPNYLVTLQYDKPRPIHVAVQGVPGTSDRAWARLYGSDMLDRALPVCEEPAQEWVQSFLPSALSMQKMFETKKPPQDYEYLLEKTRVYLSACRSSSLPDGKEAAVSELPENWEPENPDPAYLGKLA